MSSESDGQAKTICPYCGVGCGIKIAQDDAGDVTFRPWGDAPVNEGSICIKGGAATESVNHEDRLTDPLIRDDDGELREASWEEAYERITDEMERISEEYSPQAMGFHGCAKAMNEENYLIQKLARHYGTNSIDTCTRMCHASTVFALKNSLGEGAMTNSMNDLEEAADVFWIQGANPGEQHPIANSQYFRQAVLEGATVIQVDPHANKTTNSFKIDETDRHMHLQPDPGTDVSLLNVVIKTVLEEGWVDEEFIAQRTEGFDDLEDGLSDFDAAAAAEECGVPLADLRRAAEKYAKANNAAIFTGMGMSQHTSGVDNVQNEINLALITGNLGRPGTGVNPLRGQNNVQGASDVGTMPNVLPGYRDVSDPEVRADVEEVWGFEIPSTQGLTNVEIGHEMGKSIKGLYVMGENPVMSEPNTSVVEDRISDLEFLVVQDIFPTETTEYADVVLPATSWAERDGTVVNTDRRTQRMRGVEKVHPNTKDDLEIVCDIGQRLFDDGSFDFDGPENVFEELREVAPIFHGMTYDRIGEEGIHWPCYETGDEGDPFLYEDGFTTESGRGQIEPVRHQPPKEQPDEDYPLILTTGRVIEHYNTGTMSRRSETLTRVEPENFVDIHPEDATEYGVEDGDVVTLESRRGEIEVKAQVTEDIKQGTVWTTPHFADSAGNRLTNDVLDDRAKIPEYKAAAAKLDVTVDAEVDTTDAPADD